MQELHIQTAIRLSEGYLREIVSGEGGAIATYESLLEQRCQDKAV